MRMEYNYQRILLRNQGRLDNSSQKELSSKEDQIVPSYLKIIQNSQALLIL